MTEVGMRDVPEQHVLSETKDVDQAALVAWLPGAMSRVAAAAKEHGGPLTAADWPYLQRPTTDPVFVVIYEGNPNDGPTPVEVCATVPDAGHRTLPAHREAYVRVTKAQVTTGQLGGVYPAIEKWIAEHGLAISAAPRETYWTDFYAAAGGDEVFDVAFPVA
jgi:hypothetical protein